MGSYLAEYGAGDEWKAKIFRWAAIGVPTLLLAAIASHFFFRHYPQRAQLDAFLNDLRTGDLARAYQRWGCSKSNPCRDYSWDRFVADFGPQGQLKDLPQAKTIQKLSCTGGIIRAFDAGPDHEVVFYVSKPDSVISYAPPQNTWRGCTFLP
jgi:hypothetical protein